MLGVNESMTYHPVVADSKCPFSPSTRRSAQEHDRRPSDKGTEILRNALAIRYQFSVSAMGSNFGPGRAKATGSAGSANRLGQERRLFYIYPIIARGRPNDHHFTAIGSYVIK